MSTTAPNTPTATPAATGVTGTYTLDPSHTRVGFAARHAMVTKVRGAFNQVAGSGRFDAEHPERSSLSVTIDAASIDTRNEDRDAHLRSGDFLGAEQHPAIEFASTAVEHLGGTTYRVTGDLTIKGVARPISFDLDVAGPATDPFGNTRLGLEGSTVINRKDWGVSFNAALETGGVLVGEKVTLEFEVSAIRDDA